MKGLQSGIKTLKAGIVGCGNIFETHAEAISKLKIPAKLVAVCDIDEKKAVLASEKYGCKHFADYHDMLAQQDLDVVHICVPHYLHKTMAIDALRAGKHVLLEKPLAMNVTEAMEIEEETKRSTRLLCVSFQNRYNNTSVMAKKILDNGSLGRILGAKGFLTWHRNEDYYNQSSWRGSYGKEGGGVLINQAIHTLDLIQWFTGEVKAVKGHIDTRVLDTVIEVEDTAEATLYLENNVTGIFYAANCYIADSPVEIEIFCENGILRISNRSLVMQKGSDTKVLATDETDVTQVKSYIGSSHKKLIEHFYLCIIEGKPAGFVTVQEGMKSLKIIEGIYKSSYTNEKVTL